MCRERPSTISSGLRGAVSEPADRQRREARCDPGQGPRPEPAKFRVRVRVYTVRHLKPGLTSSHSQVTASRPRAGRGRSKVPQPMPCTARSRAHFALSQFESSGIAAAVPPMRVMRHAGTPGSGRQPCLALRLRLARSPHPGTWQLDSGRPSSALPSPVCRLLECRKFGGERGSAVYAELVVDVGEVGLDGFGAHD